MPRTLLRHRVFDIRERVGCASILGHAVVIQIETAGNRIEADVFQDGAEAAGATVDLGFGFRRKPNYLRIAAIFKVENTVITPAVLVIADEPAVRIGGERCLPCSRKPEEDSDVS